MSKLIQKTAQIALEEIQEAMAELRNCHEEIRKGLTAKVYADKAQERLTIAIKHMLEAESWVDALKSEQEQHNAKP
ncbi:hypothetical protein [Acinetobacter sp. HY1485]|uniref:hypothetical protein n=1 Tax=Acinetobacter sp. HY1485 TaxID=2970918 RepID=UPI0022B9CD09|nr:hypothetical protein [Acinetobacter sp. HY1485]